MGNEIKAAKGALKKQAAAQAEELAKERKMKASEMSKAILEAVDLLTEHKLERLEFDKTLVCTIEDDTNKKKGEYIVTDGSTSFTAYSDVTIYMNGLRVYVTVPNGDFDNKKIITGRYIDSENSEYYTYKPPFEDYLDMTGNLIKDNIEKGLVANQPKDKEIVLWQVDNFTQGKGYTLLGIKADFRSWLSSYKTKSGEYGLRLDIQSKETSTSQGTPKIKSYSCELTNNDMYGNPYNFETYYSQEKTFDIAKISEIVSMKLVFFQKSGTFKDKNGKEIPYSTITNKTSLEKIESDRLKAMRDLKISDFDNEVDYYKAIESINDEYSKKRNKLNENLPANLFVKNPYVSLGYAEQDFSEDTVLIMTMDSKTYDATSSKEQNTKTVQTRWIHFVGEEGEQDVVSIDHEDEIPENAEVHWYRYFLSEGLDDEIAGVFWDEIEDNKNKLSYTFYPDINTEFERIKVIVENPSRKYVKLQKLMALEEVRTDPDLDAAERLVREQEINEDYSFDSQVNYYESDVIVFENEKPVANPATVDLIQGLQISVDPADKGGLDGKYCIYGMDYKLLNNAEKERLRPLEATYSSLVTGEPALDKAAKITWYIPLQHTMIHPPKKGKEFLFENKNIDGTVTKDEATIEFLFNGGTRVAATENQINGVDPYPEEATHILISRNGTEDYSQNGDDSDSLQIEVKQYFRIKELYTPGESNNTIKCVVLKNNIEYPAEAQLTFGPQGTNGTNYTLNLEFDNNQTCLYAPSENGIGVTATLTDYEGNFIDDVTCKYSWYSGDTKKISISEGGMKATIKVNSSYRNSINLDYYILQGVVTYGEPAVNLTAYLPVPIKYDNSFTLIEAPSTIIYDNNGTNPNYYKGGLKIYKEDQSKPFKSQEYFWQIITSDTSGQAKGYYPFIRDDANGNSEVVATNSYYNKLNSQNETVPLKEVAIQYVHVEADGNFKPAWTHPILITQNRWPSAMLNKWDGTLQLDEEKGTILSQMVGAGYKDSDNQFNGVLMGNVSMALATDAAIENSTTENPVQAATRQAGNTGVYGFHKGTPSFGLMDNGTAFFGKAGAGQILIDGNKSTIQSSSYRNGTGDGKTEGLKPKQQGMCIDLDDGFIDMQGPGVDNKAVVHLDTRGTVGSTHNPYFNIKSQVGNNMMMISPNEYYLQTDGYTVEKSTTNADTGAVTVNTPGKGIKLNLKDSSLTGYDFHLKTIESSGTFKGSYVELDSGGSPYFRVHYERAQTNNTEWSDSVNKKRSHNLIYIGTDDFYLQSRKFDTTDQTGTKINLDSGKITSYNFNLEAGTGANKIIMDSTASTYPFKIGSKFKVKWDGSLEASGIDVSGTINASSGYIGSWSIANGSISKGDVSLSSSGTITNGGATLTADGKLICTAGTIGGCEIKNGVLTIARGNITSVDAEKLYLDGKLVGTTTIDVVTDIDLKAGGEIVSFKAFDKSASGNILENLTRVTVSLKKLSIIMTKKKLTILKTGAANDWTDPDNSAYCTIS